MSPITKTPATPFTACFVFSSLSLATASNNGDSLAFRVEVLSSHPPVQNSAH
jgi:hypothetical protein